MIMPFRPSFPQVVENSVEKRRFYTPSVEIICRKLRNYWDNSLFQPCTPVENTVIGVSVLHMACGKGKYFRESPQRLVDRFCELSTENPSKLVHNDKFGVPGSLKTRVLAVLAGVSTEYPLGFHRITTGTRRKG